FDQMGDDFRVGLGDEFVAFALELFFQLEIIFDDAVVNDDDFASAIPVRVSIFFSGTAVCGPARVADSVGSFQGRFLDDLFEIAEFAGSAADVQFSTAVDYGYACGIIAAVFELTQAFDDHRDDFLWADIAHDPAHFPGAPRATEKRNTAKLRLRESIETMTRIRHGTGGSWARFLREDGGTPSGFFISVDSKDS